MRYIKGKYTGGREKGLELQNDGQVWRIDDSTGRYKVGNSRFSLEMNFKNVVDGINFAEPIFEWNAPIIYFMLPETHFLFNEPMISARMYYDWSNHEREKVRAYAQSVIVDIIKTKLGIKI